MLSQSLRSRAWLFLLAIICFALFFYRAGTLPFVGADEPRYARIAQEMLLSGDWIVPHLESKPWLEKPPLYYWTTALVFALVNAGEAQARLTSALAMLGMVAAVYVYGRRWFSLRSGLLGSVCLAGSLGTIAFARAASMDALFSFLVFLGSCAFVDSLLFARRGARFELLFSAICMGTAVLAKGLIGLLLPLGILLIFLVWTDIWKRMPWRWFLYWLAAAFLVAIPWHLMAFQRAGFDFVAVYFINHQLARFFTELHHHAQPSYYYMGVLIAGFLPWSFLLPWAFLPSRQLPAAENQINGEVVAASRDHCGIRAFYLRLLRSPALSVRDHAVFFLRLLIVMTVLFFSMSASKLPGYILPAFPALALLVAASLEQRALSFPTAHKFWTWLPTLLGTPMALLGTAAPWLLSIRYGVPLERSLVLGVSLLLGAIAVACLAWKAYRRLEGYFGAVAGSLALFIVLLTHLALGPIGLVHSTRDVARQATENMAAGDVLASYRFFHHTLGYYSGYAYVGNWDSAGQLGRELASRRTQRVLLVSEPRYLAEIQSVAKRASRAVEKVQEFGPRWLLRLTLPETLK
jgi:4-amino-4-deoxy-L-arabinose transferase-like glycosyltransferase